MKKPTYAISRSDRGLVRPDNQDAVFCGSGLYVVADGMGGGAEGARASRMVCQAIERGVSDERSLPRLDQIGEAIRAANREIISYTAKSGLKQMGSTVALLALDADIPEHAVIAYVGDSRVYRMRAGRAELLTRDHSIGAELEERIGGAKGAKLSARSNPLAHVLTRAVGTQPRVEIEWRKIDVLPQDRFLVCSDGVHDVLETDELGALVGRGALGDSANRLDAAVRKKGAPDNYSFILIEIGDQS